MNRPIKRFLYCLQKASDNSIPYIDSANVMQVTSSLSGQRLWLNSSPAGWLNNEVTLARNDQWRGMFRAYTDPLTFYNDGKQIINTLFYKGRGYEEQINLIVLEWNSDNDVYELYYKGLIDLATRKEKAGQGVEVSTLEGGVPALLKAHANTIFQIACDGSIQENIKILMDGLLLPDTLHYEFINFTPAAQFYQMPLIYQNNEGDNFNIIHNDPTQASFKYQEVEGALKGGLGGNYILSLGASAKAPLTVKITGNITISAIGLSGTSGSLPFILLAFTSSSKFVGGASPETNGISNAMALVSASIRVGNSQIFSYSINITIDPGESIYLGIVQPFQPRDGDPSDSVTITGGSMALSFNSKPQDTRVWAITVWDMFRLIVQKMNLASSTTEQVFNYAANSTLLQQNKNLVITCGDALRASGDPNYQMFYNAIQKNPAFPSQVISYVYGPVIKISLADFFKTLGTILFAALGNQNLTGKDEALFFESMNYVYDPTVDPDQLVDIGEVASFESSVDEPILFNRVKAGPPAQSYDQKAGKFETNTTMQMLAPVMSVQKDLDLNFPGRTDPYGQERLRSNVDASSSSTSSTRNDSDNDWFVDNVDLDKFIWDYWEGKFTSVNQEFNDVSNTNMNAIPELNFQEASLPIIDGSVMSVNNDPSIFVFNQSGTASRELKLIITGTVKGNPANVITGTPADYCIVTVYKNGGALGSWKTNVTSAATPITDGADPAKINFSVTDLFGFKDVIYVRVSTSAGATAAINAGSTFSVGGTYFSVTNDGEIDILPGAYLQLIPFTNTEGISLVSINSVNRPIASFGFQYFVYNTAQLQNSYNYAIDAIGETQNNNPTDAFVIDLFRNGLSIASGINPGTGVKGVQIPFENKLSGNLTLTLGDIFFILLSDSNQLAQISFFDIQFVSTQVKVYKLKRLLYDSISGVPNIAVEPDQLLTGSATPGINSLIPNPLAGKVTTTAPGAIYNVEQLRDYDIITAWGSWIAGILYALKPGMLQFLQMDKNEFLSTTLNGVTKTDNSPRDIGAFGLPLVYPFLFEIEVNVPGTFAQVSGVIVNQHVKFTWNGVPYYGFVMKMMKKAYLNEPQKWQLRASPLNDVNNLIDLDFDGLKLISLMSNDIFASRYCPLQIVPLNPTFDGRFHYRAIDSDLFIKTLRDYHEKRDYFIPVQNNDSIIPLQMMSGGITPITADLYACDGSLVSSTVLTETATDALLSPIKLFEGNIDVSTLAEGKYYLTFTPGTSTAVFTTEKIWIKADWPDTMLVQYKHSKNKLSMVFTTGYSPQMRVFGVIDDYDPFDKSSDYEDEPANIETIDGIGYDTRKLFLGYSRGVPDWVIRKMKDIVLLDDMIIENVAWSKNGADAKWQKTANPPSPLKYWSLEIREKINSMGITGTPVGDTADNRIVYNIRNTGFGPDTGDNTVTQVTETT